MTFCNDRKNSCYWLRVRVNVALLDKYFPFTMLRHFSRFVLRKSFRFTSEMTEKGFWSERWQTDKIGWHRAEINSHLKNHYVKSEKGFFILRTSISTIFQFWFLYAEKQRIFCGWPIKDVKLLESSLLKKPVKTFSRKIISSSMFPTQFTWQRIKPLKFTVVTFILVR